MPHTLLATKRDNNSYRAQMQMVIGDPGQWLRIDKGDGSFVPVTHAAVVRAAQEAFSDVGSVIAAGRFGTSFAIYCTGDRLTEEERRFALSEL